METEQSKTAASVAAEGGEGQQPSKNGRKKHYRSYLTKAVIDEYKNRGGNRIVLSFVEMHGNEVGLVFTGFRKDESVCMTCFLDHDQNHHIDSRNQFFGIIFRDDKKVLLHDLFALGNTKDWVLDPEPYNEIGDYVSYKLSDSQNLLAAGRLNPSPPA